MSSVIEEINIYYKDKLGYLKVGFVVEPYSDCLIKGDRERVVEVLQNIMENAVKYGAGSPVNIAFSDEEDCRLVTISNAGCTLSDNEYFIYSTASGAAQIRKKFPEADLDCIYAVSSCNRWMVKYLRIKREML